MRLWTPLKQIKQHHNEHSLINHKCRMTTIDSLYLRTCFYSAIVWNSSTEWHERENKPLRIKSTMHSYYIPLWRVQREGRVWTLIRTSRYILYACGVYNQTGGILIWPDHSCSEMDLHLFCEGKIHNFKIAPAPIYWNCLFESQSCEKTNKQSILVVWS